MLSEVEAAPIEVIAMVRLIRYLKNIEQMEDDRWPKVVFNDILNAKERRLGCGKTTNGLVNGIFT